MIDLTGSTLFIIGSPFQCLCMLEAINHWQISDYDVMLNCTDVNERMISLLLEEKGINYVSNRRNHLLKEVLPLFFSKRKRYNKVFIGNYHYLAYQDMALAYCKFKADVIYLDDGTQALELFSDSPRIVKEKVWVIIIQALFSCFAFFKRVDRKTFFTIYNVKSEDFKIVKNTFEILKTERRQTISGVYIIGTNSSKLFLKDKKYKDILLDVVNRCKKIYSDQIIYYCPHRGDTNNDVLKSFLNNLNVQWFDTKISVEYDFVKNCIYPKAIIGFNSNALFTLHSLFPKTNTRNVCFEMKNENDDLEACIIRNRLEEYGILSISL